MRTVCFSRPLRTFHYKKYTSAMPMSSNMREYVKQGHANPGPEGTFVPGERIIQGSWKEYTNGRWHAVSTPKQEPSPPSISLVTWNVDGWAKNPEARVTAILSHIQSLTPQPDLILLQELNGPATQTLLNTPWIQSNFYSTEDTPQPENSGIPIVQITLADKSLPLGPVGTIALPSRYERVMISTNIGNTRILNVHFDSLAHDPSFRPAQVKLAAELIKTGSGGVIAGDWNPVMQVDHTLVVDNGLVDAWEEVGKGEGFTWNWDGRSKEPFPPQRLDKVAVLGVRPVEIEVLEPGTLRGEDGGVDWSDHCGLRCRIELSGSRASL